MLEHLLGVRVFRVLPQGLEVGNDMTLLAPGYRPATIFDVGANVGQTAEYFSRIFPTSRIYCFEPVTETFRQLKSRTQLLVNVHCEQLALGSYEGEANFCSEGISSMNRMLTEDESADCQTLQRVNVMTIDSYCEKARLRHVGYLKIDTEGQDKAVIQGADKMLREKNIDFVQAEVSCNPENRLHSPFAEVVELLQARDYRIFGLYSQCHEWIANRVNLRRCDVVFCSSRIIEEYPVRSN